MINKGFIEHKKKIQEDTSKLIEDTFKDLRNAEGAFDLLQKFKNVTTLDEISEKL